MMVTFSVRRISAKSMFLAALAAVLLLAVLFTGAQTASAQQGVTWEEGNVCVVDRYTGGGSPTCEANDVRITNLSPSISEACLGVGLGETTTVQFTAEVLTTSTTRYSIGFFIAQDGNLALNGDACYHDFLQPAITPTGTTPPLGFQTTGSGPYRNVDGNACADTLQNDGLVYYRTQVPVTVTCIDANSDGIVDPISTCTSWEENANGVCNDVTGAAPGTPSKCNCGTVNTNIKIYRGLDGGDLPDSYGTLFTSDGASHSIQDSNSNNTPDTIGGQVAIWLGSTVDYAWTGTNNETDSGGFPTADATGDDLDNIDDEDGVAFPAPWYAGANGGQIQFLVNASGPGECTAGNDCTVVLWLDWDNSGDFDNGLFGTDLGGERYVFTVTGGTGITYLQNFDTPLTWTVDTPLAARVRLYDNAPGSPAYSPVDLVTNGEVEDYFVDLGALSVTLSDFSAVCQAETPLITWDTVSEVETQGFNLLRGPSADGWDTQLNPTMILAQNPGNTQGGSYQWLDTTALPDVEYFYWLQDVAFNNATGLHGPISVTCLAPTAVSLSSLGANTPASSALTWWAAALAMAGLLLGVIIWQRQAQTR